MMVSFADAMNSVREWDSFQELMRQLRYYGRVGMYYIK